MNFDISAIGYVSSSRKEKSDDYWGGETSKITLSNEYENESIAGLESFSHLEILFIFDKVKKENIVTKARYPRNNSAWPKVGIFAQRGKNRPNRIGSTICRLISLSGNEIIVSELDAIEGTPVIDIKPVMFEFLPREEVIQPSWSIELMANYWDKK